MVTLSVSESFWKEVKPQVGIEVSIIQQPRVIHCIYEFMFIKSVLQPPIKYLAEKQYNLPLLDWKAP